MWRINWFVVSSLLLLFCFSAPVHGTCSENRMYQISEEELTMLETHLAALESNNNELLSLLAASNLDLNAASTALKESRQELSTLKKQLTELQAETQTLSASLEIVNQELANASASFKASEKERDRIENRLRNQRNIWEVLCCIAVGVAVAK